MKKMWFPLPQPAPARYNKDKNRWSFDTAFLFMSFMLFMVDQACKWN